MSTIRQDAWSADDDLILAEVTLRHIREGGTQLSAFEEVGERIGRTAAACGFRWNSCVRKKYEAAIQIAKAQRQKRSQQRKHSNSMQLNTAAVAVMATDEVNEVNDPKQETISEESLSIEAVIRFLRQSKSSYQDMTKHIKHLEKELRDKEETIERLQRENDRLSRQVDSVQNDYQVVNDDYKALIQIMDRARKMAFLADEQEENKPKFKMDANGNLERIE